MSAETDAGLRALQSGDVNGAIALLEQAIAADPNDYQGQQYLGAAYGQAGRQMDAVTALTQAVTLQPSNAQARYNLAVAYEGAGYKEQALVAAQQALQLQPDYPKAQEAAARLSGAPTPPGYGQPAAPQYGQPQATQYGQPQATQYGQPEPYQQNQTQSYQAQPSLGQTQAYPPAGGYAPGQPSGLAGGAPYAPPTGAGGYQSQGAAAYGGSPQATYYNPAPRAGTAYVPDEFSIKQAFVDWLRVIREPNNFFQEQAGRQGYKAPLAFLVMFSIVSVLFSFITVLIRLATGSGDMVAATITDIFWGIAYTLVMTLVGPYLWGGMLHVVGRLFGNHEEYHRTFRVAAYARAPMLITTLLISLLAPFVLSASSLKGRPAVLQATPIQSTQQPAYPGQRPGSNPGGMTRPRYSGSSTTSPFDNPQFQAAMQGLSTVGLVSILGLIWTWCLQSIGLRYAQDLSGGSAAGTVFLALVLSFILLIVAFFVFGVAIAAAFAASRGGTSGFIPPLSMLPSGLAVWRGY